MTVGELIARLQRYSPSMEVMVYNGELPDYIKLSGVVKITCKAAPWQPEIFEPAEHDDKNVVVAVLID